MANFTNASIRRAIVVAGFNNRPADLESWSRGAVGDFGALYRSGQAEKEEEQALFRAIDSVAYGIRWAETTGRTQSAAYRSKPWKETREIVERIVRICLRSGNTSASFVKDCWKELATA